MGPSWGPNWELNWGPNWGPNLGPSGPTWAAVVGSGVVWVSLAPTDNSLSLVLLFSSRPNVRWVR